MNIILHFITVFGLNFTVAKVFKNSVIMLGKSLPISKIFLIFHIPYSKMAKDAALNHFKP